MKTGLYKEMSENKSILQEKFLYTNSTRIYLPNILKKYPTNRF